MPEVVWLWFQNLRKSVSPRVRMNWLSDRLCSSRSAALVRFALELDREGTSAYCQYNDKWDDSLAMITYHPMANPQHPLGKGS